MSVASNHPEPSAETKTSRLAVTSLILGIISVPGGLLVIGAPLGLVAIVLGILAWVLIRSAKPTQKGKGVAIAGVVTGGVGLVTAALTLTLVYPNAVEASRLSAELSHFRLIGISCAAYTINWSDHLPPHASVLAQQGAWVAGGPPLNSPFATTSQHGKPLVDINPAGKPVYRYGDVIFFRHNERFHEIRIPSRAPLAVSAYVAPRSKTRAVLFADGHVEIVPEHELDAAVGEWAEIKDIESMTGDQP